MSLLKTIGFSDFESELTLTRRVLERVPDANLAWKPHEKSWSLAQLAAHIANLPTWQVATLQTDGFDLTTSFPPRPEPTSCAEILQTYDANVAALKAAFASADEALLRQPWTLRQGEQILWEKPKAAVLREWGLSHLVHHRGQLTVYLRLLDVPVPGVYGPSADERT